MNYTKFKDLELSTLGYGTMRLPINEENQIDEEYVFELIDYAYNHGVNYFDTAYPYHEGLSEVVVGNALKRYDRNTFYLATKYPGHQISSSYNPSKIFEEQLKKCGVDYFDFYLLHNVYENSIQTYMDPKWGIMDYFIEQKKQGKIKYLGFSTHGSSELIKEFLDHYGQEIDFCQIQLNYLDWTLQDAKSKYELLCEYKIPVWVMEPVRGGRLVNLTGEESEKLKALRPDESIASFGFRFLQSLDNVSVILSGMSNMEQLVDNIKTFSEDKPLSKEEIETLLELAEGMKDSLPCTSCRYCCDGCPKGLDIPNLISYYNELRFSPGLNVAMRMDAMDKSEFPSECIKCGKCTKICPQNIDIPKAMSELDTMLSKLPKWKEICRQREEAAKRNKL